MQSPSNSALTGLSRELINHIASYIEAKRDLSSLCLSSKYLKWSAEQFLYQDITLSRSITNLPLGKVKQFCKRATFLLGNHEGDHFETDIGEDGCVGYDGDKLFPILGSLSQVEELSIMGSLKIGIGQFAQPEHGFRKLRKLNLHSRDPVEYLPDLNWFAPLLRHDRVVELGGTRILPNLGSNIAPRSLALSSITLLGSVLPQKGVSTLIEACRSLRKFDFYGEDGMFEVESVNPHQLVSLLKPHEPTLQDLRIDYGLLDEELISLPAGEPLAVFDTLRTFNTLEYLDLEYDALFGSGKFAGRVTEELTRDILPQSIRTLRLVKCPPKESEANLLGLIISYAENYPSVEVTIDWLCYEYEKGSIKSEALEVVKQAQQRGVPIKIRYCDGPEDC